MTTAENKAVNNLLKWATRAPWKDRYAETQDRIVGLASRTNGVEFEEAIDAIEDAGADDTLVAIAFEALAREVFEDDSNIVNDYLAKRGHRESRRGRQYLEALRDSPRSVYEVTAVKPGRACQIKDLIRGGPKLTVREKAASRQMRPGDKIAVRVLHVDDHRQFSAVLFPLHPASSDAMLQAIEDMQGITPDLPIDQVLDGMVDLCAIDWLSDLLQPPALPSIVNTEGDPFEFHNVSFPVVGDLDDIIGVLDASPLQSADVQSSDARAAWLWLEGDDDGPQSIKASIEISDNRLVAFCHSAKRAEAVHHLIGDLLGDRVGTPLTSIETLEQAQRRLPLDESTSHDHLDDDARIDAVKAVLDAHYRATIDAPVPALGNRSPRDAVKSKSGREAVRAWLEDLERNEAIRAEHQGGTAYDFGWMWQELGVERDG